MSSKEDTLGFVVLKARSVEVDTSQSTMSDEEMSFVCIFLLSIEDLADSILLVMMRSHDSSAAL
jgi:hypothetical protein